MAVSQSPQYANSPPVSAVPSVRITISLCQSHFNTSHIPTSHLSPSLTSSHSSYGDDRCVCLYFVTCVLLLLLWLVGSWLSAMSSSEDGALDVFQLVCNSPSSAVDAYLAGHSSSVDIANDKGDTPLIMAARRGDIAVVQSLIAAGASVHTRNLKGSNPLIAVRQPTAPQSHSAVSGLTEQQHVEASQRETDVSSASICSPVVPLLVGC